MQTSTDLRNLLARIDRKGYPAYKDTRGAYQFPAYVLSIDHVPASLAGGRPRPPFRPRARDTAASSLSAGAARRS